MIRKILPWIVTILLSIVAPIIVYDVATDHGVGVVPALILSGVPPLVELAGTALIFRRLDELSTIVLVVVVVAVVTSLLFDDPKVLLLKGAAVFGLLGVAYLVSLATSRPITFLIGRRFATNGDPERVRWWNGLWALPGFRRTQRAMTAMWGLALVAYAVVAGALVYVLSVDTMVVIDNVAPAVLIAALVVVTIVWGRRAQARGEKRAAAAAAEVPSAEAPPVDSQPV